jgi:hypothetical protein
MGSLAELETQLEIALEIGYLNHEMLEEWRHQTSIWENAWALKQASKGVLRCS